MAFRADRDAQDAPVPERGITVDLMAVEAGYRFVSLEDHIADIPIDMSIAGVQIRIVGFRKVNLEILEEIISGDEIIGIGQAG